MPFLPKQDTQLEYTPEFIAYLDLFTSLIAYSRRELGYKRTNTLVELALFTTPFNGLMITEDGFALHLEGINEKLASFTSISFKREAYQKAIHRLLALLNTYIGEEAVEHFLTEKIKELKNRHKVTLPINTGSSTPTRSTNNIWYSLKQRLTWGSKNRSSAEEVTIMQQEVLHQYKQIETVLSHIVSDGVFVINKKREVIYCNKIGQQLLGKAAAEVHEKPINEVLQISDTNSLIADHVYLPEHTGENNDLLYIGKNLLLANAAQTSCYVDIISKTLNETSGSDASYLITLHPSHHEALTNSVSVDMTSVTAHELKSPLTTLRGYIAILDDEIKDTLTDDQKSILDRMAMSTNQVIGLIENLLAFSKIESKTLELQLQSVQFESIVEKVVEDVLTQAHTKQIKITFEKPTLPLPKVALDVFRMTEVLTNLITNAIKFNKVNGGVWIRMYDKDGFVYVEVSDNGCGIPEESIPKLFNKYVQLQKTNTNEGGAGLGLYISKEIITAHQGAIWVHAKEGLGSTFTFRIPLRLEKIVSDKATEESTAKRYFASGGTPLQLLH